MATVARDVASSRYMAFTTFRRNGDPVATPVWVADLGDGTVGFTTSATSGKVRRLAHSPHVVVSPCSMRGAVACGAPKWCGTARVVRGDDHARVRAAIARRYRFQLWLIDVSARLRRRHDDEVGIIVAFNPGGGVDHWD
jgi:uncharacterized protein